MDLEVTARSLLTGAPGALAAGIAFCRLATFARRGDLSAVPASDRSNTGCSGCLAPVAGALDV